MRHFYEVNDAWRDFTQSVRIAFPAATRRPGVSLAKCYVERHPDPVFLAPFDQTAVTDAIAGNQQIELGGDILPILIGGPGLRNVRTTWSPLMLLLHLMVAALKTRCRDAARSFWRARNTSRTLGRSGPACARWDWRARVATAISPAVSAALILVQAGLNRSWPSLKIDAGPLFPLSAAVHSVAAPPLCCRSSCFMICPTSSPRQITS